MGRGPNRHVSEEGRHAVGPDARKVAQHHSPSETQTNATVRFHLTPVRWALARTRGKGTLVHCGRECRPGRPPRKTLWSHLRILPVELPSDPAIPLLSVSLKKSKTRTQKSIRTPWHPQHHSQRPGERPSPRRPSTASRTFAQGMAALKGWNLAVGNGLAEPGGHCAQ